VKLKLLTATLAGGVTVPAASHTHLSPGGDHVMLMGLEQPLKPGDEVPISLRFSDGTTRDLTVPVKAFTEEEEHYHASQTPKPQ
jgi:copper(I)-binding protein